MLTSNLITAQDLRIFDNTWYLTKIVENGVDYFPPNTDIPLTFNQQNSTLRTTFCNFLEATITFENNLTNFTSNGYVASLIICNMAPFEPQYFSVFSNEGLVPTNFLYAITENGTLKTLIITNLTNNKKAIYSNQNLSTVAFKELKFSVYSNNLTDLLTVELEDQNAENVKVEIVDSLGKICKSKNFNSNQIKIETEDLCSGVYIIKITVSNEVGLKKFIKS